MDDASYGSKMRLVLAERSGFKKGATVAAALVKMLIRVNLRVSGSVRGTSPRGRGSPAQALRAGDRSAPGRVIYSRPNCPCPGRLLAWHGD